MLEVISAVSTAKRKWCSCRPSTFTSMSSYSNFRIAFSRVAVIVLAIGGSMKAYTLTFRPSTSMPRLDHNDSVAT
ncbi:hypothetical protein RB195_001100 [Necator americanus]|uniref:Uncharacterized protein n=1 Tax=Necator americanus TaxID=51031 RepID=A0ABR1DDK2_NECAM